MREEKAGDLKKTIAAGPKILYTYRFLRQALIPELGSIRPVFSFKY